MIGRQPVPISDGSMRKSISRRDGYVLVLVLVILMIASVAMVRIAGESLARNSQALESADALQAKWGRISCERAVLPRADTLFASWESTSNSAGNFLMESSSIETSFSVPPGQSAGRNPRSQQGNVMRTTLRLGGQSFHLLLSDENAKANLRQIALSSGGTAVDRVLRSLVPPRYYLMVRNQQGVVAGVDAWGQLFDLAKLRATDGGDRALAEMTLRISIWGNGRLNVHRADEHVIRSLCRTLIPAGTADRLIETLQESPNTEVEIVLERAIQNTEDRAQLREWLSDSSACYSMWTEATTTAGQRSLSFAVRTVDDAGRVSAHRFTLD